MKCAAESMAMRKKTGFKQKAKQQEATKESRPTLTLKITVTRNRLVKLVTGWTIT